MLDKDQSKHGIYFFLGALCLSLIALFALYRPFLINICVAFLIFLCTQSIFVELRKRLKSELFSALAMSLGLLICCFSPLLYFGITLASFSGDVSANFATFSGIQGAGDFLENLDIAINNNINALSNALPEAISEHLGQWLQIAQDKISQIDFAAISKNILNLSMSIGKSGAVVIKDFFFIIIFLFFFYFYGAKLGEFFLNAIPIDRKRIIGLYKEVSGVMGVVFYSSLLTMLLEGTLFGICAAIFGYSGIFFGLLYGFMSLIPLIGGIIVWGPLVIYELYLGNIANAIIITSYSLIIIATLADNFIKPIIIAFINRILKTPLVINELLIFFAIFAGLASFGFWGIIFGPAITALFIALIRVYNDIFANQNTKKE